MPINSPNEIPGCIVWLDATDAPTLSSSTRVPYTNNTFGEVTFWGNKSLSATLMPFVSADTYIRGSTTFNSNVMRVSSTELGAYLSLSASNTRRLLGNFSTYPSISGISWFILSPTWASNTAGSSRYYSFVYTVTSGTTIGYLGDDFGSRWFINNVSGNCCVRVAAPTPWFHTSKRLIASIYGSTEQTGIIDPLSYHRVDDQILSTTSSAILANNLVNNNSLHSIQFNPSLGPDSNFAPNNSWAEIILFNRALTVVERNDVISYLQLKHFYSGGEAGVPPRNVYPISNGLWSNPSIWNINSAPSPFNLPLTKDNVFTNNFQLTANVSSIVNSFNNIAGAGINAGGTITLSGNVTLSANTIEVTSFVNNSNLFLSTFGANTTSTVITRNFTSNTANPGAQTVVGTFRHIGDGTLRVIHENGNWAQRQNGISAPIIVNAGNGTVLLSAINISPGSFTSGGGPPEFIVNTGSGTVNIVASNIFNNFHSNLAPAGCGITNSGSGTINVYATLVNTANNNAVNFRQTGANGTTNIFGDILNLAPSPAAMATVSNGGLNIIGNTIQGTSSSGGTTTISAVDVSGLSTSSTGSLSVTANRVYATQNAHGINHTSTTPLSVTVANIIDAPNGRVAIRTRVDGGNARMFLFPIPTGFKDLYVTGNSLGGRTTLPQNTNTFTLLTGVNISNISCGANYSIAQSGNTTKWFGVGDGSLGVFGQGNNASYSTFTLLTGDWSAFFTGYSSVFALSANTRQWFVAGDNQFGQLGLGHTNTPVNTFTPITGDWIRFAEGSSHTFAQSANNRWFAVGKNDFGQLGLYDTNTRTSFQLITGNYTKIVCGLNHTVALSASQGRLDVWGSNAQGQIGLGSTVLSAFSAFRVPGTYTDIGCGDNFTCAISAGPVATQPTLVSTGDNTNGQLGLGNNISRSTFHLVSAGMWDAVVCGRDFTFARDVNTGLWAGVGENSLGQLGNGTFTDTNIFTVTGNNTNIDLFVGSDFVYALDTLYLPIYQKMSRNASDSFLNYYSENVSVTPPLSTDVVFGVTYNSGTLTGAMIVPPITAVNAGVLVGSNVGTAYLSLNDFWNLPLSSISINTNTIGEYMLKTLTTTSLSSILNSLDYSKV